MNLYECYLFLIFFCFPPDTRKLILVKFKMSKIEKEEVKNDSDEEKDSGPVSKVKSYTDIMKRKLDK